jgi:hypothetical protein
MIRRRVQGGVQTLEHLGDLAVFIPPPRTRLSIDVFQIRAVSHPHLHLVGRADRHQKIAFAFDIRPSLLAETFGDVSANRFARAADLIRQHVLLDRRKPQ